MGFFNKLYLINLISQNNFFLFNFLLLTILMFGLYFYMQNLRFLHSTNYDLSSKPFLINEKVILSMHHYLLILIFILVNGFFIAEFFFDYYCWLLL